MFWMKNRAMLGTEISDFNIKVTSTPVIQPIRHAGRIVSGRQIQKQKLHLFFRTINCPPNIQGCCVHDSLGFQFMQTAGYVIRLNML
jgi:hypothetical protein